MIKIIKSGKKEFHATCPFCGCEFTYEVEDLNGTDYDGHGYVNCPECNALILHVMRDIKPFEPIYTDGGTIKPSTPFIAPQIKATDNIQSNNPCSNCSYTKKLATGQVYVGDPPCTWCEHNPFRVTCTSVYTTTSTNTNTDVSIDTGKTESGGITFNNDKN